MTGLTPSPEAKSFIRSFNARRRCALFSQVACAVTILVAASGALQEPLNFLAWKAAGVLFLCCVYFDWIRAKCPKCGRYIGYASWSQRGLPSGLRCDMEIACLNAVEDP